MKYLVRKDEMKQYDANTIAFYGIPSMVLIERAALAAVEELVRGGLIERDVQNRLPVCGSSGSGCMQNQIPMRGGFVGRSRILIACGVGNNGADGLVMARLLHLMGHEVLVLAADNQAKATEENRQEFAIAKKYGVRHETFGAFLSRTQDDGEHADHTDHEKHENYADAYGFDLVIDAVFGVGLSREIGGSYRQLLERLNGLHGKKIAVDIPSGIDADDGSVLGVAFRADLTVTFSYEKLGMRLFPGQEYCGTIICRSVGIDDHSFLEAENGRKPMAAALTEEDLSLIPERRPRTNKGSYGKVLVIAGSVGMAGAAYFSAKAAYLSGCGLVRILTPEENRVIIQSTLPEAVLTTYRGTCPAEGILADVVEWADAVVCGPGLGKSDGARELVRMALKYAAVPMVLDADALNILSEEPGLLQKPHGELIVTPHLGEMARLLKCPVSDIRDRLTKTAEEFARDYNLICVLKDARTVTAVPEGMTYVNLSGNNGMATGGSGDVLTGVLAGLLAQGLKPELAAPLGVYVHGAAGDAAAERVGHYSLTAQTLLDALPVIFGKVRS